MFTMVAISGRVKPSRLPRRISREPDPVAVVEDPGGPAPLGGEQPDVLVVAQRAQRDAVLVGQLGDRPGPLGHRGLLDRASGPLRFRSGSDRTVLTLT